MSQLRLDNEILEPWRYQSECIIHSAYRYAAMSDHVIKSESLVVPDFLAVKDHPDLVVKECVRCLFRLPAYPAGYRMHRVCPLIDCVNPFHCQSIRDT